MSEIIAWAQTFFTKNGDILLTATADTLLKVTLATLIGYAVGIAIAMVSKITEPESLHPHPILNAILGWIINMGRSIPFVILIVALIPFTRFVTGSSIGPESAIIPLTVGAIPFIARLVENSFSEVSPGRIEAGRAFGANTFQILTKVYVRESLPSLVRGMAIVYITLIGYDAILGGAVAAGGLGDVAIRYGYQRYETDMLVVTVVIMIVLVQIVQSLCDVIARRIDKR